MACPRADFGGGLGWASLAGLVPRDPRFVSLTQRYSVLVDDLIASVRERDDSATQK